MIINSASWMKERKANKPYSTSFSRNITHQKGAIFRTLLIFLGENFMDKFGCDGFW